MPIAAGEISREADQALDALLREVLIGLVERELEADRAARRLVSPTGSNRDRCQNVLSERLNGRKTSERDRTT